MIKINENFLELQDSYLFSTIAKKVAEFQKNNPEKRIIKLGIGDVTRPIVPKVVEAMKKAVDELGNIETFRGYGPEQGYDFLREKIAEFDYKKRGININIDEIFVSDGAKCDCRKYWRYTWFRQYCCNYRSCLSGIFRYKCYGRKKWEI